MTKVVKVKNKGGRPITKFTPENVKSILADIAAYVPYQIACDAVEVHEDTFRDWRNKGKEDIRNGVDSEYAKLVGALGKIQAQHVKKHTSDIVESPTGHGGAQWILGRAYWKYFGESAPARELAEMMDEIKQSPVKE